MKPDATTLLQATAGSAPAEQPRATDKSNAQLVWDAIVWLSNEGRHLTRGVLFQVTGLRPKIVDDHIERLVQHGRVRRLGYGVLEVVEQFPPPRPISKTILTDGLIKLEIGDVCLSLTPEEARRVGAFFSAELLTAKEMAAGSHALARLNDMAGQMRHLQGLGTALMDAITPVSPTAVAQRRGRPPRRREMDTAEPSAS